MQGSWGFLGKGSSGEILLRLTYKAYVEDEEDDRSVVDSIDTDASDDELSDSEESSATKEKDKRNAMNETEKESFMDVLAALIVSEEFQGIVSSETGYSKTLDDISDTSSKVSRSNLNAESIPSSPGNSEASRGTMLTYCTY